MSSSHAQSVTLVLSLLTGLVSPQYHVLHDDRFETVGDALIPKKKPEQLAKFQSNTPQALKLSEGDDFLNQCLQFCQQPMQELDTNLKVTFKLLREPQRQKIMLMRTNLLLSNYTHSDGPGESENLCCNSGTARKQVTSSFKVQFILQWFLKYSCSLT